MPDVASDAFEAAFGSMTTAGPPSVAIFMAAAVAPASAGALNGSEIVAVVSTAVEAAGCGAAAA